MFKGGDTTVTAMEAQVQMREDDYTGHLLDDGDDDLFPAADAELFDWEDQDDSFPNVSSDGGEDIIVVSTVADGAKTLRDAAKMLYDFADELLEMSASGWELLDSINNGQGIVLNVSDDLES